MADDASENRDQGASEVERYFNLAAAQQTRMNLFFIWDKCQISSVRAPCVMVKKGLFVVRSTLAELDKEPVIWGAEVNGFFTVRDLDLVSCNFKTRLARLYNAPPDAMLMVFPLPRSIEFGQQRFSRRVNISHEATEGFGVWYGEMSGGDMDKLPQLRWRPFDSQTCELDEMSASGMRLDIPAKCPLADRLSVGDPILLKGNFGIPNKPQHVFVLAEIVRKTPRRDVEGQTSLGCHFRSWRRVGGSGQDSWFRAESQEGIGIINQWLSRNFRGIPEKASL